MLLATSMKIMESKHGDKIDCLEENYVNFFGREGFRLVLIPNTGEAEGYFEKLPIEGIILSGGNDVNPEDYGGLRAEGLEIVPERDKTEKKLLEIGIRRKLPILGICRGMQFINVYFGGKLAKVNMEGSHAPGKEHETILKDEFKEIFGERKTVNSYHNWGMKQKELAKELKAFAVSPEGVIEGIYHPELPILGVQWHPERKNPEPEFNRRLIKRFFGEKLI